MAYTNKNNIKIVCCRCGDNALRTAPSQKYCLSCSKEVRKIYKREQEAKRRKKPLIGERMRRLQCEWRLKNRDHVNKRALELYYINNKHIRQKDKEWREKRKRIVFEHYGVFCKCCNEKNYKFLTLDHINNDGNIQRKVTPNQKNGKIYKWLIDNKFPKDFQILCMNCNFGKRMNNGICPHLDK